MPSKPCKDDEELKWFDLGGGKGEYRCVKKTKSASSKEKEKKTEH